jgi:hypothetical protein
MMGGAREGGAKIAAPQYLPLDGEIAIEDVQFFGIGVPVGWIACCGLQVHQRRATLPRLIVIQALPPQAVDSSIFPANAPVTHQRPSPPLNIGLGLHAGQQTVTY